VGARLRRPASAGKPTCHNPGMNRRAPDNARRRQGIRWSFLAIGLGGLLYGAGSALVGRKVPVGVVGAGVALIMLAFGVVEPPARINWTRRTALVSLVVFAVGGTGLIAAGLASLVGLLGPTEPGGFRTNDFAAVTICFGAVALVFAYGSYRSMQRIP
jgi:hypothetical protein